MYAFTVVPPAPPAPPSQSATCRSTSRRPVIGPQPPPGPQDLPGGRPVCLPRLRPSPSSPRTHRRGASRSLCACTGRRDPTTHHARSAGCPPHPVRFFAAAFGACRADGTGLWDRLFRPRASRHHRATPRILCLTLSRAIAADHLRRRGYCHRDRSAPSALRFQERVVPTARQLHRRPSRRSVRTDPGRRSSADRAVAPCSRSATYRAALPAPEQWTTVVGVQPTGPVRRVLVLGRRTERLALWRPSIGSTGRGDAGLDCLPLIQAPRDHFRDRALQREVQVLIDVRILRVHLIPAQKHADLGNRSACRRTSWKWTGRLTLRDIFSDAERSVKEALLQA